MPINERMTAMTRVRSEDVSTDADELAAVRAYLEEYAVAVRMLRLCREDRRERERLAQEASLDLNFYGVVGGNEAFWLNRTRRVREFVHAIPYRNCKMLLFYYYICGMTVERCAEELDLSRRSAFRLKKLSLAVAAKCFTAWRQQHDESYYSALGREK